MAPIESADEAARRTAQEAEAERQRIAAEQRAARESGVMLHVAGNTASARPVAVTAEQTPELPASPQAADDPNRQHRKNATIAKAHADRDVNPHRLTPPVQPWTLQSGSVIEPRRLPRLSSVFPWLDTAQRPDNAHE